MIEPTSPQVPVTARPAQEPSFRPFKSFAIGGVSGGLLAVAIMAFMSKYVRIRLARGDVTVIGGELLFYLALGIIAGFLWPALRVIYSSNS